MNWPNSHTNNGFPALRWTPPATAAVDTPCPAAVRSNSAAASRDFANRILYG